MEGCPLDGPVSHISANAKIRKHIISRVRPGKQTMFDLLSACSDEMSGPVSKGRVVATVYLDLNMAFDNTFPTLPLWKEQKCGLDKPPVWMN